MKPVSIAPAVRLGDPATPLLRRLVERLEAVERRLPRPPGSAPPAPFTEERSLLARVDSRAADAAGFEQQRVLHRAIDEEYFHREIKPGSSIYYSGVTETFNGFSPVMRFPDGAASGAVVNHEARALWVGTRPRVTVWYTSPVGSTANFNLFLSISFYGAAGLTAAPTTQVSWTAPGPAVAGTVQTTTAVLPSRVLSSPFGVVAFEMVRNQAANDANVNALDVLLAVVVFEEVA